MKRRRTGAGGLKNMREWGRIAIGACVWAFLQAPARAGAAAPQAPGLDFDQGVDARSLLDRARGEAAYAAFVAEASPGVIHARRFPDLSKLFKASPVADAASWDRILRALHERGEYRAPERMSPASLGLTRSSGSAEGERRLDAVRLWGYGGRSDFRVGLVTMVSEEWRSHGQGGWRVEQWHLRVAKDGRLLSARHRVMLRPRNGRPVEISADELWATEEPVVRKFQELIPGWAAFDPPGSGSS